MLDHDIVAVAAVPSAAALGDDDRAFCRSEDRRIFWCADIDTVIAMEPLGQYAAINRPCVITTVIRPACIMEFSRARTRIEVVSRSVERSR
jgi:hypothetical protein